MTNDKQKETKPSATENKPPKSQHNNAGNKNEDADDALKKDSLGADYWERIAGDVVSGYEGANDKDDILNADQEADDNLKGDEVA